MPKEDLLILMFINLKKILETKSMTHVSFITSIGILSKLCTIEIGISRSIHKPKYYLLTQIFL